MRTIKCKLSTIQKAIDALDEYERKLKSKNKQMLEKIVEVGTDAVQYRFMHAKYDGEYSVQSHSEFKDDSTAYVVGTGDAIAFIEFGNGFYYPDEHPKANEAWTRHGSWSMGEYGKGHWDDENGWWYDTGGGKYVNTYGNPANMCMYNAARDMESKAVDIAKEVFGK